MSGYNVPAHKNTLTEHVWSVFTTVANGSVCKVLFSFIMVHYYQGYAILGITSKCPLGAPVWIVEFCLTPLSLSLACTSNHCTGRSLHLHTLLIRERYMYILNWFLHDDTQSSLPKEIARHLVPYWILLIFSGIFIYIVSISICNHFPMH